MSRYKEYVLTPIESQEVNKSVMDALDGHVDFIHSEFDEFYNQRTQQSLGDVVVFGIREDKLPGLSRIVGDLLVQHELRMEPC